MPTGRQWHRNHAALACSDKRNFSNAADAVSVCAINQPSAIYQPYVGDCHVIQFSKSAHPAANAGASTSSGSCPSAAKASCSAAFDAPRSAIAQLLVSKPRPAPRTHCQLRDPDRGRHLTPRREHQRELKNEFLGDSTLGSRTQCMHISLDRLDRAQEKVVRKPGSNRASAGVATTWQAVCHSKASSSLAVV